MCLRRTHTAETTCAPQIKTEVTNQFASAEGDVTYLSRADGFANYDEATAAPASLSMTDEQKATFLNNGNYDPANYNNEEDEMPTTGADQRR